MHSCGYWTEFTGTNSWSTAEHDSILCRVHQLLQNLCVHRQHYCTISVAPGCCVCVCVLWASGTTRWNAAVIFVDYWEGNLLGCHDRSHPGVTDTELISVHERHSRLVLHPLNTQHSRTTLCGSRTSILCEHIERCALCSTRLMVDVIVGCVIVMCW